MNETERIAEWVRWYKASPHGYRGNALIAILKNDPKLLPRVLRELGLASSLDVVKALNE